MGALVMEDMVTLDMEIEVDINLERGLRMLSPIVMEDLGDTVAIEVMEDLVMEASPKDLEVTGNLERDPQVKSLN